MVTITYVNGETVEKSAINKLNEENAQKIAKRVANNIENLIHQNFGFEILSHGIFTKFMDHVSIDAAMTAKINRRVFLKGAGVGIVLSSLLQDRDCWETSRSP